MEVIEPEPGCSEIDPEILWLKFVETFKAMLSGECFLLAHI